MGSYERRKGARFEREVARKLAAAGYCASRNLEQYQETSGRDLKVDAPLCIQCKAGKRPNWEAALREAMSAAGTDYAVAITHQDHGLTVAHLPLSDLLELLAMLRAERCL